MSSLMLSHEQRAHGPWVKLQSEPKLFTALMYDLGVRGAQATEVFVLDDTLDFDDLGMMGDVKNLYKDEEYTPVENPSNVYFANQVIDNACATLAMLNIALNNPRMELGDDLKEFKEFTKEFSPPMKGFAITNHPAFRLIHNSMARHPEEALVVEEAIGKSNSAEDEPVEAYHYIAYVPVDGEVWQLDGLYPHPVSVGKYTDKKKWYDAAREVMRTRTQGFYKEQVNFVLLAITKDQLGIRKERVKECSYLNRIVEARLNELNGEWRSAVVDEPTIIEVLTTDEEEQIIERDGIKKEIEELDSNRDNINKLVQLRTNWVDEIRVLQKSIDRENKLKQMEKTRQTFDYGPFIREYVSILHERGELKELLNNAEEEECEIVF